MYKEVDLFVLIIPFLIAFAVSLISGRFLIPFLRKVKAGQTERNEGLESHQSKTGTPNMGGFMFLIGAAAGAAYSAYTGRTEVLPVLILTAAFAAVGFIDDFIKVVLKRSDGLRAWQKFLLQILVSGAWCYYTGWILKMPMSLKIPFMPGSFLDFGLEGNAAVMIFIAVATVNGTNFTDGVDGLAGCVTVATALFLTVTACLTSSGVAPMGAAMIGALLGFLVYNAYPAQVFMGDTGSLALGGFVAAMCYSLQLPLLIPVIGFIYMLEVISVILQVGYFKITHGKRIFRMAPIHHHFEKGGWSEVRVVAVFTVVTVLLCAVSLLGIW